MSAVQQRARSRAVVVVGVDLSDVSEHLLENARDLVRTVDDAELHVVHVVRPESLRERLVEPVRAVHVSERANAESAGWQLQRLCETIVHGSGAKWVVHTPVGDPASQLTEIARKVRADIVVVEAHEHAGRRRLFHRSAVARLFRSAPCSVLAIRQRGASANGTASTAAETAGAQPARGA
jgi:nucleotide-binding universal stress UspA family protein